MSAWTVTGESGKSLGTTAVDLENTTYRDAKITRTNQGDDSFSFFAYCENAAADPPALPDFGQKIAVQKSGVRQFEGHVTSLKFVMNGGLFGWQVQAENGWRELDRIALTATDKAYIRAQGSLSATITDIIIIAIAGGARLQLGTVSTMFDIPPIEFKGTSCGAALIELLRICADAVAWIDYAPAGLPTLNITRRGSMTAKTFTLGVDEVTEPFSVTPIPSVTPTKVTVSYATANANGVVTEYIQTAGSGSDSQSVILTNGDFAAFTAQATAGQQSVTTTTAANWALAYAVDTRINGIAGIPTPNGSGVWSYADQGTQSNKGTGTVSGIVPKLTTTAPNTNAVITGEYREWMTTKLGITSGKGALVADFYWKVRTEIIGQPAPVPSWLTPLLEAGAVVHKQNAWWTAVNTSQPAPNVNTDSADIIRLTVELKDIDCISQAYATATTLRDPGDYGTLAPPSTLAADLLSAQNFLPYEGSFALTPWHTPERLIDKKISFSGANPRLAAIGALVQEETFEIGTGMKTVSLGLPARAGNTSLARLKKLQSGA